MKHNKLFEYAVLFIICGITYYLLEVLARGHSYFSMLVVGGLAGVLIGGLNNTIYNWSTPLILQQFVSMLIITSLELISGLILNTWLNLGIWDYSNQWGNIAGQICPKFMVLWFFVSLIGIFIDDFVRWKFFDEDKPHYKLF